MTPYRGAAVRLLAHAKAPLAEFRIRPDDLANLRRECEKSSLLWLDVDAEKFLGLPLVCDDSAAPLLDAMKGQR